MPIDTEPVTRTYCEICGDRSNGERYCTTCRCSTCGGGPPNRYRINNGYQMVCLRCYALSAGLTICACGDRIAEVAVRVGADLRGHATGLSCSSYTCLAAYRCIWCANDAHMVGNSNGATPQGMCSECSDNSYNCCYEGNCTPRDLCDSCLDAIAQRDEDHSDDSSSALYFRQEPVFHSPTIAQRKVNRSARMMAVEIEVSALNHDLRIKDVVRNWGGSIVEDGSLPGGGIEINTGPAGGDLFLEQIDDICEALADNAAQADAHCGLHIHIDTRDHTYSDMRKLMLFYAKIEPALIRTQPYSRVVGGHYSIPCGKKYLEALENARMPKELKKKISALNFGKEDGRKSWITRRKRMASGDKFDGARYNALNISSWFFRGTVECRLHSGTTDAKKIKAWGLTWAAIVDRAYAMTEHDIQALPAEPINILMDTAPVPAREVLAKRIDKFGSDYDKRGW